MPNRRALLTTRACCIGSCLRRSWRWRIEQHEVTRDRRVDEAAEGGGGLSSAAPLPVLPARETALDEC